MFFFPRFSAPGEADPETVSSPPIRGSRAVKGEATSFALDVSRKRTERIAPHHPRCLPEAGRSPIEGQHLSAPSFWFLDKPLHLGRLRGRRGHEGDGAGGAYGSHALLKRESVRLVELPVENRQPFSHPGRRGTSAGGVED
eukprot:scaffold7381_cov310-Pinguiococcus_pyrenoidosus.AAC.40